MEVATRGRCAACGEVLPANVDTCPSCGAHPEDLPRRPRFTFAILILLLLAGFGVTGSIVRGFNLRRHQLAERWYARGERELENGSAVQAVNEFQTALAYSRDNDTYRLKLALALMQSGKWEEARAHLLNLWEQRPGDGEVNLLLGRVFAHRNLTADALRYYHGAIYGVWATEPVRSRESARYELIDFLLAKGQKVAAQAELIALAAEVPGSTDDQQRLAGLMLKADEPQRALAIYDELRRKDRGDFIAVLGAARAQFQLLRFANALALAREAERLRPESQEAKQLAAETETLVLADPRAPGIGVKERGRRAYAAFNAARARLESCATSNPGDVYLKQLEANLQNFDSLKQVGLRDQDLRDQVTRWAYDVEIATAKVCGDPKGADATFLRLASAQERER